MGLFDKFKTKKEIFDTDDPKYANSWIRWYLKGDRRIYDNPRKAMICFEKALEINPECAQALTEKGKLLMEKNQFNRALDCFEKALEIKPEYHFAWHAKGLALSDLEQFKESTECFEKGEKFTISPIKILNIYQEGRLLAREN